MSRLNQIRKNKKLHKFHKSKAKSLKKSPQRKALCLKIVKESPKKPNSAKRSVAKVKLSTGKKIRAQIPGEGHRLIRYNRVLIRGGRTRDLPGVRYRIVRGVLDCTSVSERRQGISKYGMKSSIILEQKKKEKLNELEKK